MNFIYKFLFFFNIIKLFKTAQPISKGTAKLHYSYNNYSNVYYFHIWSFVGSSGSEIRNNSLIHSPNALFALCVCLFIYNSN